MVAHAHPAITHPIIPSKSLFHLSAQSKFRQVSSTTRPPPKINHNFERDGPESSNKEENDEQHVQVGRRPNGHRQAHRGRALCESLRAFFVLRVFTERRIFSRESCASRTTHVEERGGMVGGRGGYIHSSLGREDCRHGAEPSKGKCPKGEGHHSLSHPRASPSCGSDIVLTVSLSWVRDCARGVPARGNDESLSPLGLLFVWFPRD